MNYLVMAFGIYAAVFETTFLGVNYISSLDDGEKEVAPLDMFFISLIWPISLPMLGIESYKQYSRIQLMRQTIEISKRMTSVTYPSELGQAA